MGGILLGFDLAGTLPNFGSGAGAPVLRTLVKIT